DGGCDKGGDLALAVVRQTSDQPELAPGETAGPEPVDALHLLVCVCGCDFVVFIVIIGIFTITAMLAVVFRCPSRLCASFALDGGAYRGFAVLGYEPTCFRSSEQAIAHHLLVEATAGN